MDPKRLRDAHRLLDKLPADEWVETYARDVLEMAFKRDEENAREGFERLSKVSLSGAKLHRGVRGQQIRLALATYSAGAKARLEKSGNLPSHHQAGRVVNGGLRSLEAEIAAGRFPETDIDKAEFILREIRRKAEADRLERRVRNLEPRFDEAPARRQVEDDEEFFERTGIHPEPIPTDNEDEN